MATVYRIEGDDGIGPYRSIPCHPAVSRHYTRPGEWPGPWSDCGLHPGGYDKCGFTSMKQLRKWFSRRCVERLMEDGFCVVAVMNVEIVAEGYRQCVFEDNGEARVPIPYDHDDSQKLFDWKHFVNAVRWQDL